MFSWPIDFNVHRFCKLGFCLVSFNATLALVGQLWKTILHASLCGVPMSTLAIHTYQIQWHAILLLHFFSRSRTESDQVSLNHILMWLSTRHKLATEGQIDEASTLLVSWHAITSNGLSPPHLHGPVTFIVHPITLVLFNLDIAIIKYDYFTKTTCLSLSMENFKDHNFLKCISLGESY